MTSNALQRLPPGSRVAVIRLRSLGDCVLTTPAIALLKTAPARPGDRVVVEDRFAPVFRRQSGCDAILPPTRGAMARWQPELTLNLHGGTTQLATHLRLARQLAGRL